MSFQAGNQSHIELSRNVANISQCSGLYLDQTSRSGDSICGWSPGKKKGPVGPLFMNGNSARLKSVRLSRRRVSWIAIAQTLARDLHAQRARAPQPALSRLFAVSRAACAFALLLRDREAKARPRMA